MFRNYIKTTVRYLRSHRLFTVINLVGLATALSVTFFAILFVRFELSYDHFNPNRERIFRISTDVKTGNGIKAETSFASLAPDLSATLAGVEEAGRVFIDYYIVQKDDDPASEETLVYADPSVFSLFSFSLLRGNVDHVFTAPFNLVLSETYARRYFGSTDCLGSTLTLDGHITATVTGVMEDAPLNSHFRADMLLSISSLVKPDTDWMRNRSRFGFSTYVLLKPGVNLQSFQDQLQTYAASHPLKNDQPYQLTTEPLSTLYLHGSLRETKAGSTAHGNPANIYIFALVALFVLLIACFNFINLTTAFSLQRTREVGVRKVIGASRAQLVFQFLSDAVILNILAFAAAIVLAVILLPIFNSLAGKTIALSIVDDIRFLILFFGAAFVVGILSGLYPALSLSSFHAVDALKQRTLRRAGGFRLREILVVSQFVVSTVLIIATLIIFRQLNFMQDENLGFKKEHNLVIDYHYDDRITGRPTLIDAAFKNIPGVSGVSMSSCIPGRANKTFSTNFEMADGSRDEFQFDGWYADDFFLKQYGIALVAGRGFSSAFTDDTRKSMILNETAVRKLGYQHAEDAIGKTFVRNNQTGTIVGVVKDFRFHSAHKSVEPLTIQKIPGFYTFLTLTVQADDLPATIRQVEKEWKKIVPNLPMVYFFSDDTFHAQYLAESRFGKLFTCFAVLAILISCLGLFGLSSFYTVQRTREIGIRKVLGAGVGNITALLTRQFVWLVILAFVIATPLAWYFMNKWLQSFAYRIDIKWWMFALGGSSVLIITLLTVGWQAVRAAIANPVRSLRSE